ncbi:MAG TPA: hypothetical protein VF633_11315 [Brevundimonas sp.]|jgi:hypothetical protein
MTAADALAPDHQPTTDFRRYVFPGDARAVLIGHSSPGRVLNEAADPPQFQASDIPLDSAGRTRAQMLEDLLRSGPCVFAAR